MQFRFNTIFICSLLIVLTINKKENNMKNKLLLTTAIAGLTAITGFAHAETKVSGNMEQTFKASSIDSTPASSGRGFGTEMNIGLSSSKDLDNGLKASYGFNLEMDSDGTDSIGDVYYMTIGSGDVSISIARDNGQNLSSTMVPHISDQAGTVVDGETLGNVSSTADAHNQDHIRIDGKVMGGTLTVRYAPDSGNTTAGDSAIVDTANSVKEIMYSGSLGVDGLKVQAGTSRSDGEGSANEDIKFTKYGASYNFGQFAVGADLRKEDSGTVASKVEKEAVRYGLTFAANDNLSFGISYQETEEKTAGVKAASDEETILVGVGYNFGGLGIDLNYAQVDNLSNTSGADADFFQIRTIQKF